MTNVVKLNNKINDCIYCNLKGEEIHYEVITFSIGDTKAGTKMGKLQLKDIENNEVLNCILWEEALNRMDSKLFRCGNVLRIVSGTFNEKFNNCLVNSLELIKEAKMDDAVLKYKSYEAMVEVANGQATKIIVPSELQNLTTAGITFHETAPANNPKKKHAEVAPAAPVFTPDACEFANVISVALSCATENTEILYTIAYANNEEGGEEASEDNNGDIAPFVLEGEVLYTAPFELSETATVTAYARLTNAFDYNGGYVESEVVTAIYTLNPEVGVENVELAALVYANNGMIYVETAEGNMVEVFTVQGQRIYAAEATDNLTTIEVPTNIVLVRVAGQTVKVAVK